MRRIEQRAVFCRARASSAALLPAALVLVTLLAGCEDNQIDPPRPDPNAVIWTRVTGPGIQFPVYPDWRVDSIVFAARGADGNLRLAVTNPDGSSAIVINYPGPAAWHNLRPRWVREGLWMFQSNRSGSYDVRYYETDAGTERRLTTFPGDEHAPAPRPGFPSVVYQEGEDYFGRLVLIPDTANVADRSYLTPPEMKVGEPDWDPAGARVCFTADSADVARHIWVVSIGDTIPKKLTSGPYKDYTPRFSPDGTKIVFVSNRNTRSSVWWVSDQGEATALRFIAWEDLGALILTPSWSPDGKEIILSSQRPDRTHALYRLSNLGF